MGEFKRSPSKVWWGNDSDVEWRTSSSSPGSQDSGFSDSEIQQNRLEGTLAQRIPKDIFKDLTNSKNERNLSSNFREKTTPNKKTTLKFTKEKCMTEPTRKNHYVKFSSKVSRSLFTRKNYTNELVTNQYSENDAECTDTNSTCASAISNSISTDDNSNVSCSSSEGGEENDGSFSNFFNRTAPPILENFSDEDEGVTAFNESFSDSECDELEDLFDELDSPKHTSTPKFSGGMEKLRRKSGPLNLFLKFQKERVPPTHFEDEIEDKAVLLWLQENRPKYDAECMTSLQCKSIAAELNEKVSYLANTLTLRLKEILKISNEIELEWNNINSGESDKEKLINTLMSFFKTYTKDLHGNLSKQVGDLKAMNEAEITRTLSQLYNIWQSIQRDLYSDTLKKIVTKLEYPASEIDLKATVTAITILALKSEKLNEIFVKLDSVPMLLIHCEKSEGSSLRCLILRALSTMCCTTSAVRNFEKYSGIQLITDILEENSRPEPERSEAVTLLAQVTAPWIDDNYSIRGLPEYADRLVKSLTKFLKSTKCCQNLLLCAAALSNMSAMDAQNTTRYILKRNSVAVLLDVVTKRGNTSVFIFEQVAALIASVSAVEFAKKTLVELRVPAALLCFLQVKNVGENVEKRLQQKTMIALSRLCGDPEAARQIVETGGVDRLVKLCREKEERFNSDAVLVAALASLRKIVETCGKEVISFQDSQELIEPKLLDSFLAYSNQNESYV